MTRPLVLAAVVGALLGGCGDREDRPPGVLFGADICDRCRMVISERRHAAAAVIDGDELRFDDPGCLRESLETADGPTAAVIWVRDESESWRRAEQAWFVVDRGRSTPMASGILAFGSEQAAIAAVDGDAARVVRWSELGFEAAIEE